MCEGLSGHAGEAELVLPALARVVKVVYGHDKPRPPEAAMLVVRLPVQHGRSRRVPVMHLGDQK